jgi:hypothetical protein
MTEQESTAWEREIVQAQEELQDLLDYANTVRGSDYEWLASDIVRRQRRWLSEVLSSEGGIW